MLLLDVLLKTASGGAGLGPHLSVKEVITSLKRTFQQGTGIVAYTAGKIISRNVRRSASGRSQSDGKAARKIEEDFRHKITGVADGSVAVSLSLFDKVIIRLLKELLKKNEMF